MQTHQDIWFSVENENEWVYFNTAHRPHPVMEFIPWPISVSSIIFSDGSQQYTAGGGAHTGMTPPSNPRPGELWFDPVSTQLFIWYVDGGFGQWVVTNNQPGGGSGTGATLLAGPGIALTPGAGTMTISNTAMGGSQTPWVSNIDGAQYDLLNVKNINVTQSYSINGVPFAVAGSINLTNINQISGVTGQPIAILSNTAITGTLTVNGNSVLVDPTTTLGDLLVRGATAVTRLPIGADGDILMVDDAQPNRLRWDVPPSAPVSSVFGRTGAVVAATGDYTAAQVTNAVSTLGTYSDPSWITSLDWSKIDNIPSGLGEPAGATGQVQFNAGGTPPVFGANTNLAWDITNHRLTIGATASAYPLTVNGDINIIGTAPTAVYRVNGAPLAFDATQINLNPGVGTWTTVQNAVSGINTLIQTLSRGMAYVGTFNAATNVATFVPSVGIAAGPLPAPNATGLHPGDFIIVTDAGTGPGALGPLNVGDQLLTDGTNWDVIAVGHSLASVTAATVPLSPVIGSWNTVQDALTALNTLNTNAVLTTGSYANPAWITSLDWSKITNAPAGANLWQTASGGRIYYSGGDVGIGTNDPQYTLDIDGDLNITGDFSINDIVFAAAGSVNLQATSITGLDGEPLLVNGDVTFELHGKIVSLEQVLNRLEFLEAQLSN